VISDEEARARAVDPRRSVILQAPAGSGKTTVLIERLLVLLAQADTPEEILAITFTRKAAAEMALRVAQVLQQPSALAQAVRARSQARGWRLLENPNRLRIQTLDALNRALALQMPLAARGSGALGGAAAAAKCLPDGRQACAAGCAVRPGAASGCAAPV
jgi:ATP-dependent helicase/nuclease subunit A